MRSPFSRVPVKSITVNLAYYIVGKLLTIRSPNVVLLCSSCRSSTMDVIKGTYSWLVYIQQESKSRVHDASPSKSYLICLHKDTIWLTSSSEEGRVWSWDWSSCTDSICFTIWKVGENFIGVEVDSAPHIIQTSGHIATVSPQVARSTRSVLRISLYEGRGYDD